MGVKEKIKLLIDVDVDTDDLALLLSDPDAHVASPEDAENLKDLFKFLDDVKALERNTL